MDTKLVNKVRKILNDAGFKSFEPIKGQASKPGYVVSDTAYGIAVHHNPYSGEKILAQYETALSPYVLKVLRNNANDTLLLKFE